MVLGLAAVLLAAPPAHAEVTLRINNKSGQPVCVMWTGMTSATGVTTLSGLTSSGANILPSDAGPAPPPGYSLSAFTPVTRQQPELRADPQLHDGRRADVVHLRQQMLDGPEHGLHAEPRGLQRPQLHAALRQDRSVHHGQQGRQPRHHGGRRVQHSLQRQGLCVRIAVDYHADAARQCRQQRDRRPRRHRCQRQCAGAHRARGCRIADKEDHRQQSLSGHQCQLAGKDHRGAVYLLSLRQQRRLRAHHRQRQPDRHVRGRPPLGGRQLRGPGQLQLGQLQQLPEAHGRPRRFSLHGHHHHLRKFRGSACRPAP